MLTKYLLVIHVAFGVPSNGGSLPISYKTKHTFLLDIYLDASGYCGCACTHSSISKHPKTPQSISFLSYPAYIYIKTISPFVTPNFIAHSPKMTNAPAAAAAAADFGAIFFKRNPAFLLSNVQTKT